VKLICKKDVIGLSAETDEERSICTLLAATDGHVFRLHSKSGRGLAFSSLGPQADACREPLNITRSSEARYEPISNLARTPFEFDGMRYESIEGFWQGLKFADPERRRTIAGLWGIVARKSGMSARGLSTFHYGDRTIVSGSPGHWALMRSACEAKFNQHAGARAALLGTGQRWLTHRVRKDSITIPGAVMAQIWMDIRRNLQNAGGQ
jgi:predicted NAD-dependent protein-ADP-ribosyltransferase YbiA (DUF1768 family)